jgi:uncharacterized protein YndB with AHSA1/START domain
VAGPVHTLRFDLALAAPPARVFAALTEARHLERWFCDHAESDGRPGGRLLMAWTRPCSSPEPYEADWVVFDPPRACAHAGGHSGYPDAYAGRIDLALEPEGDGTRLRVTHAFPPRRDYDRFVETYAVAWPKALARLEAYLTPLAATEEMP